MNTKPETDLETIVEPSAPPEKPSFVAECLLAIAGLLLTIFATFVEASITNAPWRWWTDGIYAHPLGTTYQVGAVLLTACVGGANTGAIAQIGYVLLGLSWLPIFASGGGWDYWQQLTFGYLVGFIPGAWCCGWLAYRIRPRIELLAGSALVGLGIIHLVGMLYLSAMVGLKLGAGALWSWQQIPQALLHYSIVPLPGQIIVVCLSAVLAYFLRRILFL